MKNTCCNNLKFERNPNPTIADIGSGGGAEYTVGRCCNCGAIIIHCWVGGGVSQGYEVVSQDLIDTFLNTADEKARKRLLGEWFNKLS